MRITVLMMEENIFGRTLLEVLCLQASYDERIEVNAVIVERGTARAEAMKEYLKNDFGIRHHCVNLQWIGFRCITFQI